MSAQGLYENTIAAQENLAVSFRLLLGLYLIIPLCLSLQFSDALFWGHYLRDNLPSSPTHFILFSLFFGTPHIIASALLLTTNREYFGFYKNKILWMTACVAVFFGLGSLYLPYKALYVMVAAWTVFHVLKQQHGVARGICKLPPWAFHVLLGLSVAAGVLIYIGIFLKNSLTGQQSEWLQYSSGALCAGLILVTAICQRYVQTRFGWLFLWANTLLVVSSFYLFVHQYFLLAILVPRLVHDMTAYLFYVTHDYNRHNLEPKNSIYRWAKRWNIPVFVVLPLLSVLITFFLQQYGDEVVSVMSEYLFGFEIRKAVTLGLIGYLGLLHYYTEAFTWKNDSPYRQYIRFTR
ncbi:MAG: hypothetical protein KGZ88_16725 [Methylomicrobium sp.]|nr:hypothetical protein [Methylomicrobium sp.]